MGVLAYVFWVFYMRVTAVQNKSISSKKNDSKIAIRDLLIILLPYLVWQLGVTYFFGNCCVLVGGIRANVCSAFEMICTWHGVGMLYVHSIQSYVHLCWYAHDTLRSYPLHSDWYTCDRGHVDVRGLLLDNDVLPSRPHLSFLLQFHLGNLDNKIDHRPACL